MAAGARSYSTDSWLLWLLFVWLLAGHSAPFVEGELAVVEVSCTTSSSSPLSLANNTAYYLRNCTRQQVLRTPPGTYALENVAVTAVGGSVQPLVAIVCDASATNVSVELVEIDSVAPETSAWLSVTAPRLVEGVRFAMDRVVARNKRGALVTLSFADHVEGIHMVGTHCDIDFSTANTVALFSLFGDSNGVLRNVSLAIHGGRWRVQMGSTERRQAFLRAGGTQVMQHITITLDRGVSLELIVPMAFASAVDSVFSTFLIEHSDKGAAVYPLQLTEHVAIDLANCTYRGTVVGPPASIMMDIRMAVIMGLGGTLNDVRFTALHLHAVLYGANQGYAIEIISWGSVTLVNVDMRNVYANLTSEATVKSSGARTATLFSILRNKHLSDMDVVFHNVTLDVLLRYVRPLEVYSASTGALLVLQQLDLATNVTVDMTAVALTASADEATAAMVLSGVLGIGQQVVTLALAVFASAFLRDFRFSSSGSHVSANATVVGPDFGSASFILVDYVVVAIGTLTLQANCTHCVVTIDRCDVLLSELHILAPAGYTGAIHYDGIDCTKLVAFNVSGFVIGLDSSPVVVQCLSGVSASTSRVLPPTAYQPVVYTDVVVDVRNSRLMVGPAAAPSSGSGETEEGPLMMMAFGPPGISTDVSVVLDNVTVALVGTVSPTHRHPPSFAALVALVKSSMAHSQVSVRNCMGFQSFLHTTETSAVRTSSMGVRNSSFTAAGSPIRPVSLLGGISSTTLGGDVALSVSGCSLRGLSTLFGRTVAFEVPQDGGGGAGSASSYVLGCNDWDLLPTTVDVYRNVTFDAADGNRSAAFDAHLSLLNLSLACARPPAPPPPVAAMPAAAVVSRAAGAVGVAAMTAGSALPTMGAATSLVRLQTSMMALNIRDSCNGTAMELGTSIFENPTQVAVDGSGVGAEYRYAAGAVLMNTVLVLAVTVLGSVCRHVEPVSMWRRLQRPGSSPVAMCGEQSCGSWASWRRRLVVWLCYAPGSGIVVFAILLQPSVVSAVALLSSGGGAEVVIGLIGLAMFVGGFLAASRRILWGFPLVYYVPSPTEAGDHEAQGQAPSVRSAPSHAGGATDDGASLVAPSPHRHLSILRRVCRIWLQVATTESEWRPPHSKNRRRGASQSTPDERRSSSNAQEVRRFINRYAALFDSYRSRRHWYFVVELGIAVCCGVLSGMSGVVIPCDVVLWLLVGLCGAGAVCAAALLPNAVPLHNGIGVVANALGFAACLLVVVNLDDAAETVAMVQLALSMAAAVVDAAKWATAVELRRRKNNNKTRRSIFASLSDVLAVGRTDRFRSITLLTGMNQPTPEANLRLLIRGICSNRCDTLRGGSTNASAQSIRHRSRRGDEMHREGVVREHNPN